MNIYNYKKYIVSDFNSWNNGLIMQKTHIPDWEKWGMIISHNLYSNNYDYCEIGYSLLPIDNFNYLKYNKSKNAPWVNQDWLPFWSYLTINKSKILISLEYTFFKKKCNILFNIIKKISLPIDIINIILSFNHNFYVFNLLYNINNHFFKYNKNIKKIFNFLHKI
jgi:hypothetical protein